MRDKKKLVIHRIPDTSNQEALTLARWEQINSLYKRKLLFMYTVYLSDLSDDLIKHIDSISSGGYDLRNLSNNFAVPRFKLDVGRTSLRKFIGDLNSRYLKASQEFKYF